MKNKNNKHTPKRTDRFTFCKAGQALLNGLQWKAKHNGNIAVRESRKGKPAFMGGPIRPMKSNGLVQTDSHGVDYQRCPFSGALVKV